MENENKENMIENNNPLTIPVEVEQMKNNQENENDKKKKFNKKYLLIIFGIIIILLIAITLYFTVFKKENKKPITPNDDVTDNDEIKEANNILKTKTIVMGTKDKFNIEDIFSLTYQYKDIKELHIESDNNDLVNIEGWNVIAKGQEGIVHLTVTSENKKTDLQVTIMKMVDNIFDSLDKQNNINYTNHIIETSTVREDDRKMVEDYTIYHNHEKEANIELYSDCSFVSGGLLDDFYNSETRKVNFDGLYKKIGSDDTTSINISDLFRNNIRLVELKDDVYFIKLIDDRIITNVMGDVLSPIFNTEYYVTFENNTLKKVDMKLEYGKGYYREYYQSNEFTFYENKEPEELNHMKMCASNFEKIKNTVLKDTFHLELNGKTIDIEAQYTIHPIGGEVKEQYFENHTLSINNNIIIDNEYSDFIVKKDYLENYSEFGLNDLDFRIQSSDFKKIKISNTEYLVYDKIFSQSSRPFDSEVIRIINDNGKELLNLDNVAWDEKAATVKKDKVGCNIIGYDCKENSFIKYNENSIQYIDINIGNKKVLEKEITIVNDKIQEKVINEYEFDNVIEYYNEF